MDEALVIGMGTALRKVVAGGVSAIDERRVRGLLADRYREQEAASAVVCEALRKGIPAKLAAHDPQLVAGEIKRQAKQLKKMAGSDMALALGAVEVWALALGLPALTAEDRARTLAEGDRRFVPTPREATGYGVPIAVVLGIFLLWPEPLWPESIDARNPSTWPVGRSRAVIVSDPNHLLSTSICPPLGIRARLRGYLFGTGWRVLQQGVCVRSAADLSGLGRTANVDIKLPDLQNGRYYDVVSRTSACPAGTEFESQSLCLVRIPAPASS